ncbi:CRISPR-associated helicase Cas3' [Thermoanaerobacterium thermosulfurigenes]|uniref:CRISPR-associated helicase Cas3' n=1 Tax=Thermoanaerobacterium thermosulfurigenes TaxID=33950 RepID=UPI003EF771FE
MIFNEVEYVKFFKDVTGFEPYDFQIDLATKVFAGKNVIMQAPTGSGKTWASIMPFLFAYCKGINFPRKLIYSLPLRVLTNSLFNDIREKVDKKFNGNIQVTIQTGENSNDPYFLDGDIIFTTIDQSLSSLLSIPFSLSNKQSNINTGAIISSYLIFDEFHLLDVKRSLSTLLNIVSKLDGITPYCLMSATLSSKLLDNYCKKLNGSQISIKENEVAKIKSQKDKVKRVFVKETTISAEEIIKNHVKKTIAICNTVETCQNLFLELKNKIDKEKSLNNVRLLCIHSRFSSNDRKDKEELIKKFFNKYSDENVILISTQVIEVGLDITCDVMHLEISPINSFLQRIGRCARYEGENGKIFVYDVNRDDKTKPYLPYDEELCVRTLNKLKSIGDGVNIDYQKSEVLINDILTDKELRDFERIEEGKHRRFTEIVDCWINNEKGNASRLIRDIDTINVLVVQNVSLLKNPYTYDAIPINRYTLISRLKKVVKEDEEDWLVRAIEESFLDDEDLFGKFNYPQIAFDDIRLKVENRVILNSKYVFYDYDIGLNLLNVGQREILKIDKLQQKQDYIITKDTYEEHIRYMMVAFDDLFKVKYKYIFLKLKERLNLKYDMEELIRFIIIMHDYGKLNAVWQASASKYQNKKGNYNKEELLAHTDYNPNVDENNRPKLPNHAGIGGVVAASLAGDILDYGVCIAILNAIAKHHSVKTESSAKYRIMKEGKEKTLKLIKTYCPNLYKDIDKSKEFLSEGDEQSFNDYAVNFNKFGIDFDVLLYFLFVRILRICDQKSFAYKQIMMEGGEYRDDR